MGKQIEPWDTGTACIVCGNPIVQRHHVFHGSGRRQAAEKYGYVVMLCARHHTGDDGIHQHKNRQYDLNLMRAAQRHFEENYGDRQDFIREFGKSWLEDEE